MDQAYEANTMALALIDHQMIRLREYQKYALANLLRGLGVAGERPEGCKSFSAIGMSPLGRFRPVTTGKYQPMAAPYDLPPPAS